MSNQTLVIISKELRRFFGDRQMLMAVLLPGLMIYLIYSLLGSRIANLADGGHTEMVELTVIHQPAEPTDLLVGLPIVPTDDVTLDRIDSKEQACMLLIFPEAFDSLMRAYDPASGLAAPNVEIYYCSTNKSSQAVYSALVSRLTAYENGLCNHFDINRSDDGRSFDRATDEEQIGEMLGSMLPMLIMMLIFSGCIALGAPAIAGEKERGTLATLLVTPLSRSQLALGKVIAVSVMALISGCSSFLGIMLSLPKLMAAEGDELNITLSYTTADYALLLLVILSTTLLMVSLVLFVSAFAHDAKQANSMSSPLMILMLMAGLLPGIGVISADSLGTYAVPFINGSLCMTKLLSFELCRTELLITLLCNVGYVGLFILALTRMFNSERIMFGK